MDKFKVFDSHFHIIDRRFPLIENQGFLPGQFTRDDYLAATEHFHLAGGAIVSGSFQGLDQSYLEAALKAFGPRFVGVTQLPDSFSDQEICRLNRLGVRGIRFNAKRGGSASLDNLERLARRIYAIAGWHVELYIDSAELSQLYHLLITLPAVSIAHLGLSEKGFPILLRLAEKGVVIKATGFSRVDFDVSTALKRLVAVNPDTLIFGTDLPSTRAPVAYSAADLQLVISTLGPTLAGKVLYDNAVNFYRPAISHDEQSDTYSLPL